MVQYNGIAFRFENHLRQLLDGISSAGLRRHLAKAHHSEGNADQREAMDEESQMDEEQPIKTDDLFEAGDIKVECQSDEDEEMS